MFHRWAQCVLHDSDHLSIVSLIVETRDSGVLVFCWKEEYSSPVNTEKKIIIFLGLCCLSKTSNSLQSYSSPVFDIVFVIRDKDGLFFLFFKTLLVLRLHLIPIKWSHFFFFFFTSFKTTPHSNKIISLLLLLPCHFYFDAPISNQRSIVRTRSLRWPQWFTYYRCLRNYLK